MKRKICFLLTLIMLFSIAAPGAAFAAQKAPESENGYIIKLKDSADVVRLMSEDSDLEALSAEHDLYRAGSLEEVEALGSAVEYYEPDATVRLFALSNDRFAKEQWSLEALGMDKVWSTDYNGAGVRVAIVDSGVNTTHEDFEGVSIDRGANVINGSRDVTDESSHGTFIAGIIAAATNNGIGIAGLLDGVTIVPIKCFGRKEETNASYVIKGIYAAVDDLDCDVINLSLGVASDSATIKKAVEYAAKQGVIVVAAVGNDGTTAYNYPAANPNVVGVGSIGESGAVSEFSQKNDSVFVTAPGEELISLGDSSNTAYMTGGGTSFAAPYVTAAAAVLKQYAPTADTEDFMELLKLSSHDAGEAGYDNSYGYGTLNMAGFIEAMEEYSFPATEEKFSDVTGHWAADSINYCVQHQLFNGVSEGSFAPESTMDRAMFVTVLSRMSGEKISDFPVPFADVQPDEWFAQPVGWGSVTGIVSGVTEDSFAPYTSVTREQMASLLYRYFKTYGLHAKTVSRAGLSDYSDGNSVSSWARTSMQWAVANGLMTGRADGSLAPQSSAKRCEVAAIIERFERTFGKPRN